MDVLWMFYFKAAEICNLLLICHDFTIDINNFYITEAKYPLE